VRTEELPSDPNRLTTVSPANPPSEADSMFGVQVQEMTPEIKSDLGLKSDSGVIVIGVAPNSPAAAADIQSGDVITEVGRAQITNIESFKKALSDQKGKPNLLLLLDRKGIKTYSIVKVQK
jgi:serine protease Do